jgi:hypothetical protein
VGGEWLDDEVVALEEWVVFLAGSMKPYDVGVGQHTVYLRVIFLEFLLAMLSGMVSSPHRRSA